jgi:hypothetical protein
VCFFAGHYLACAALPRDSDPQNLIPVTRQSDLGVDMLTARFFRRRRFQFSLRSLMLVVTFFGILFSVLAVKMRQAERQAKAVANFKRLNQCISIGYDYQWQGPGASWRTSPPGPSWLRKLLGDDFFCNVSGVYSDSEPATFTDVQMAWLADFPHLQSLTLNDPAISDAGMVYLERLVDLESLTLMDMDHSSVSDNGLQSLACLYKLQELDIGGCSAVTGAGMKHLENLTALRRLRLYRIRFSGEDLKYLGQLSQLTGLSLIDSNIDGEGLAHLKGMTRLSYLSLTNSHIAGSSLRHLRQLEQLEGLYLDYTQLDDEGLQYLSGMKKLRKLDLNGTPMGDAGLVHIAKLEQLEALWLVGTKISDDGMKYISRLTKLKALYLKDTAITDKGLQYLRGMKHLTTLGTENTRVTKDALIKLGVELGVINQQVSKTCPTEDDATK